MGIVEVYKAQIDFSCGSQFASDNILFIKTSNCNDDVYITADVNKLLSNEDAILEGDVALKTDKSIYITGIANHSLRIKPFLKNDVAKKVVAYDKRLPEERRTRIKTVKEDDKTDNDKKQIVIYPNPADTDLTISSTETIFAYRIYNQQGVILIQENFPDNYTISVNALQTGLYYIRIQTPTQAVVKTFYKN